MMCFAESHKLHECSDVNKVVDEFRQQMKNDVDNLNETMRKCEDALKEHEKIKMISIRLWKKWRKKL
jgi:hypothetical protein